MSAGHTSGARERLLGQFRQVAGERLGRITAGLMELEAGPNPEVGQQALRELHGLKGEARMMGFAEVNQIVHEMEELVRSAQPLGFALAGGAIDSLLAAADAVGALVGVGEAPSVPPDVQKVMDWLKQRTQAELLRASAGAASSPAAIPVPPAPLDEVTPTAITGALVEGKGGERGAASSSRAESRADGSVRLDRHTLDAITSSVTTLQQALRQRETLNAKRQSLTRELAQIARLAENLGPQGTALAARIARTKDQAAELLREGRLLANAELREIGQLSEEIQTLRMLPLGVLFDPYPRMVRDLARELGKEVELSLEGEDTRADRSVVDALREPLLHLVRNALDHGLERLEARRARGKPPRGRLSLRSRREGERILLVVEDDGGGIDPARLRQAAVQRGMLDEKAAAALADAGAMELIFVAGFSSRESASDLSGRGVGLDAVRFRMQELGGEVTVQSTPGVGTRFELRVPVSLTMAPLLFVKVGDERLGVTAAHVSQATRVEPAHIRELAGRPAISLDDQLLPFASAASLLGLGPERPPQQGELILLLRGQGASAAISVDRVLEERVQAILPLQGVLSRFRHLAGATPLADGSLALVLSAAHLIAAAQGTAGLRVAPSAHRAAEVRRRKVLVVDDSPLTRDLLSSLMEAVGYDVQVANDGVEALERLGRAPVDLVVTDLEMPRMDGLELTRRLKSHPTLRAVPVVMVTTRGSESDRKRGMEAGADAYIAKGDLVRQDLVDVVARLLS